MQSRRIKAFVIVLVCLAGFLPTSSHAAGTTTYDLKELGLSIDIPEPLMAFTLDTPESDPVYTRFGLSKTDMDRMMTDGNIYLNALEPDLEYEIVVTKISSPLDNFSTWSDILLLAMTDSFGEEYKKAGYTYIKSEIYTHPQAKFIKIYLSQKLGDQTVYGLQYYTVYDDQAINVTIHSYTGMLGEELENVVKEVVDSVDFWNVEPPAVPNDPFEYVHQDTGLRFTVPAGWEETELSKERNMIVTKFSSMYEGGLTILYGCADFWEQLPAQEKIGYDRIEADNSILDEESVTAFAAGTQAKTADITKVTYGGKEYFKVEATSEFSAFGFDLMIPMTSFLRMENGYLYSFQFSGGEDSGYYQDMEALLNSVVYPEVSIPFPTVPVPSSTDGAAIVFSVVFGGAIIVGLFLFFASRRKAPRETEKQSAKKPPCEASAPVSSDVPPQSGQRIQFCYACGARLSADGKYCHQCGTKVDLEI